MEALEIAVCRHKRQVALARATRAARLIATHRDQNASGVATQQKVTLITGPASELASLRVHKRQPVPDVHSFPDVHPVRIVAHHLTSGFHFLAG